MKRNRRQTCAFRLNISHSNVTLFGGGGESYKMLFPFIYKSLNLIIFERRDTLRHDVYCNVHVCHSKKGLAPNTAPNLRLSSKSTDVLIWKVRTFYVCIPFQRQCRYRSEECAKSRTHFHFYCWVWDLRRRWAFVVCVWCVSYIFWSICIVLRTLTYAMGP